ncbi:MAG: ABC transporter permease [Pirellulaceae bacterium]
MFRFAPYVLKGLWRHRARTFLTVSGSAVALFVFCFVGAVQEGMQSLTQDEDTSLIVFQENRFCPTTSRLPQDYAKTIAAVEGVTDVIPIQVFTNNCRASLDIVVFNGVPAEKLRRVRDLTLMAGSWEEFQQRSDGAMVGRNVATRRNLKLGDTFSIGEVAITVAAIFQSEVPAEQSLIYTHLEYLQQTSGLEGLGVVTQFEAQLAEGVDADIVAATIDEQLHTGPVATITRRKGVFQASTLADLVSLVSFIHWLGYACVGLVLSLVATTTVMAVQDRIREHAILQTIGLRPARIFRLVVAESAVVCLLGGISGTGLALLVLGSGGLALGAEGVAVAFRPSLQLGVAGVLVSLVVGLLAGIVPAWHAARAHIVPSLRQA